MTSLLCECPRGTGRGAPGETPGAVPVGAERAACRCSLRLERGRDGRLMAVTERTRTVVHVRRCFPWTSPAGWISLRDDQGEEVALVRDPEALDGASAAVLEEALAEAGFLLKVTHLLDVDEEVEIRTWRVRTRQGERTFQTKRDEWPRELPAGGVLIRDVAGDLYHVPDPASLDARSRKLLWAFVD